MLRDGNEGLGGRLKAADSPVLRRHRKATTSEVLAKSLKRFYAPLVHGWESFFTVTSEPLERRGRPWVAGYILNNYGFAATRVQLLVDGLDDNGRVVSQSVSWLGSLVPPGARVYFEVPAPEAAARYRVSVFAFDWVQSASADMP